MRTIERAVFKEAAHVQRRRKRRSDFRRTKGKIRILCLKAVEHIARQDMAYIDWLVRV